MKDLEQKAREIVENINLGATDSSMYAAFCLLENQILKALNDVREADAKVADEHGYYILAALIRMQGMK